MFHGDQLLYFDYTLEKQVFYRAKYDRPEFFNPKTAENNECCQSRKKERNLVRRGKIMPPMADAVVAGNPFQQING